MWIEIKKVKDTIEDLIFWQGPQENLNIPIIRSNKNLIVNKIEIKEAMEKIIRNI